MKWLALVTLLLVACTPKPPPDPALAAELAEFDVRYEKLRSESLETLRAQAPKTSKDFRERTLGQDLDDWFFSRAASERIEKMREDAGNLRGDAAHSALLKARELVQAELARGSQISFYWVGQRPAPYWRHYWRAFFESNGAPVPEPDSRLLDRERRMRAALEVGDFKTANADAPELVRELREAISTATRHFRSQTAAMKFVPRKSPCGPDTAPIPWQEKAKFVAGESIESFYPRGAIERGEEGAVILRLRIARSGCMTAAAIAMHSGIADLDGAALQWAEASRFAPASSNGRAIDSELSLKLVFKIEESEPAK